MKPGIILAVAMATLSATSAADAALVTYTNSASFASASGTLAGFEDFEIGQQGETHTYSGFTLTELGGINFITNFNVNSCCFSSSPVQAGSGAAWFDDNDDSIGRFVFNAAINALGLYVTTSEASQVQVTIGSETVSFSIGTSPTFVGIISDTLFTTVDFAPNGGPNIAFDSASFGTVSAVPLPATSLLLLGALGMLGISRTRRRSA